MKDNKLIAEFMGVDQVDIDQAYEDYGELKYHISWDWLMPVVGKVNETSYKIVISSNITELFDKEDNFINFQGDDIKINTYKAVVEFIKQNNK